MKIGILTFHRCINYGSYWQARCLVEGLTNKGHEVSLIDYYYPRADFAEWRCALRPVLPTPVKVGDQKLYRQKIAAFFSAVEMLPRSSGFMLNSLEKSEDYEMIIVGSDEVWNLSHPWYGTSPAFYGYGLKTSRLVSYAASFGNYNSVIDLFHIDLLKKFRKISVRDHNSFKIIKNSLGIEPLIVPDPTLQFPSEKFNDTSTQPYAIVYGHNFSKGFADYCVSWKHERSYKLLSIGYRNDWADVQLLSASPEEFADYMSSAVAIMTNFFHGCIFAFIGKKPFVCETTDYRSNKIESLMNLTGGERYIFRNKTKYPEFRKCLDEPLDSSINDRINHLRKVSDNFLEEAMNLNEDAL